MRNRLVAVLLLVVGVVFVPAVAAVAQTDSSSPGSSTPGSSPSTTAVPPIPIPPDGVDIGGGEKITGAVVTLNGDASSPPRTMNAYQAAVFVQSWFADALYNQALKLQDPPAQLPVYRIDVNGTWGVGGTTGVVAAYYATDGTNVWVAFPSQAPGPEPIDPPPPSNWFVAPPRVIDVFNGTATLVQSSGVVAATATTKPPGEAKTSSGSSNTAIWVALVVGVVIVLVGGAFILRRRRAGMDDDDELDEEDDKARV